MAYLGNVPAEKYISFERQVFTIVNSQTAYTLDHSVTNENDIRLVINNIVQEPGSGKAYTASGTTLTLSAALTNGTDEMYCVFLGRAVGTVNAPAGSVGTSQLVDLNVTTGKIAADAITEAKIADGAVESEHLNNNVISGQTELAVAPADTDEFLVSDAGTIKRIDYSLIKGGVAGTIGFRATSSSQTIADQTFVKITTWSEAYDNGSCWDNSNAKFQPTTAGKYLVYGFIQKELASNAQLVSTAIYKNGSAYEYAWDADANFTIGRSTNHLTTAVDMNGSTDYVEFYGYANVSSGTVNASGGTFGAFLII